MIIEKMNEYQSQALGTAKYPKELGIEYTVLGLCSEAGELAGKLKKIMRDEGNRVSIGNKIEMAKELGDVLWYVAVLAYELDYNLNNIAEMNIEKLTDRHKRNVIGGSGDNR